MLEASTNTKHCQPNFTSGRVEASDASRAAVTWLGPQLCVWTQAAHTASLLSAITATTPAGCRCSHVSPSNFTHKGARQVHTHMPLAASCSAQTNVLLGSPN